MNTYYAGGKNEEGLPETPHITGKVFFEIRCAVCNYGLCKRMTILKTPRRKQNLILVEPCPNCLAGGATVKLNSEWQEKGG
jgi:hypothetical protein